MNKHKTGRNVGLLSVCQALAQTQMVLVFSVSAIIGATLAPERLFLSLPWVGDTAIDGKVLATVPISLQFITMTLSTVPAAQLMKRIGRARGFIAFLIFGSFGGGLALYSLFVQDFWLFCLGSVLFGSSAGSNQQFRFAAVDAAEESFKSRAVSLTMAGGVFAGIAGPTISTFSYDMLAPVTYAGAFAAIIVMQAVMIAALLFTDIPPASVEEARGPARPLAEIATQPKFVVAVLSGMLGYGVMNFVMLSTPLVIKDHPLHSLPEVNDVIMWHVLGMFAPSFLTGWLIKRYGDINIIAAGALASLACVFINLSGESIWHFRVALALVGVGWNFMFIGGTTLLIQTYAPAEKAKVQGVNDFFVFGMVALCSLGAGATYQFVGWQAINLAVIPALVLVLAANLWLRVRRVPAAA